MKIKPLNPKEFRPYGYMINYPNKHRKGQKRNLFRIVFTETRQLGWRIAYLVVRDKRIRRLENHPDSLESFEPVRGKGLLYVATQMDEGHIECFALTQPIILKKGTWHGVVTVTDEWELKLTENANVKCVYWPLGFKVNQYGQKI